MFTGLIESVGQVAALKPLATGYRLEVVTALVGELTPGQSVAVNGVCLTIVSVERGALHADISPETVRVTTLGSLRGGTLVNLERPLLADGRLGGHLVQGHVDATGMIEDVGEEEDFCRLTISFPPRLAPCIVPKGSIAVDGISLTVASLGARQFDVQIIPFTLAHTNLRAIRVHDPVNIECDMIGKYVARAVELAGFGRKARKPLRTH